MHSQKADFSLPGENNPFHGTHGDARVSSSIATAGSAGCFTYLYNLIVIVIVCLVNPNTTDRPLFQPEDQNGQSIYSDVDVDVERE